MSSTLYYYGQYNMYIQNHEKIQEAVDEIYK